MYYYEAFLFQTSVAHLVAILLYFNLIITNFMAYIAALFLASVRLVLKKKNIFCENVWDLLFFFFLHFSHF